MIRKTETIKYICDICKKTTSKISGSWVSLTQVSGRLGDFCSKECYKEFRDTERDKHIKEFWPDEL